MALKELKNSIDGTSLSVDNFKAIWKKHIQEYWINSADKNAVDLKLDIIGDETLRADNDVTDHYVESNEAYQDQITRRPKVYTINGEVGELVWYQREPMAQKLGQVAQKLEGVVSFLPIRSKGFNQMKKTIMKASQWVDTASNAVQKLSSLVGLSGMVSAPASRQEQAFQYLLLYRDIRKPLTIKTPWGYLINYVITNLEFRQPKETKDKTYISITFKEFRTTSIQVVEFDENKYQGNAALENQPKEDQGKQQGEDVSLPKETETTPSGQQKEVCESYDDDGNMVTATLGDDGYPEFTRHLPTGTTEIIEKELDEYYGQIYYWENKCTKQFEKSVFAEVK